MSHSRVLRFTDLTLRQNNDATSTNQSTIFVPEESKKSSFSLSSLIVLQIRHLEASDVNDNDCVTSASEMNNSSSSKLKSGGSIATAAISCCSMSDADSSSEIFLFGGFELIASVNSLRVFVTRSDKNEPSEEYLTSCKGLRARDLPQLENDRLENADTDWFKFILASPGGAKPVLRVRLEFDVPAVTDKNVSTVIARTMKVKCRLNSIGTEAEGMSRRANEKQPPVMQVPPSGMGTINKFASMMSEIHATTSISVPQNIQSPKEQPTTDARNMNNLASMSTMMNSMTMLNTIPPHTTNMPSLQQQNQQRQDRNHAEMMSSIAGLGMFLKSSEEKTRNSLESMLLQMESRLSKQFDSLSCRLDAIEQHISAVKLKESDNSNTDVCQEKNEKYTVAISCDSQHSPDVDKEDNHLITHDSDN